MLYLSRTAFMYATITERAYLRICGIAGAGLCHDHHGQESRYGEEKSAAHFEDYADRRTCTENGSDVNNI